MNSFYTFSYKTKKSNQKDVKLYASDYDDAIMKGAIILERLNNDLDLIGYDSWDDVVADCYDYNIEVSDLNMLEE